MLTSAPVRAALRSSSDVRAVSVFHPLSGLENHPWVVGLAAFYSQLLDESISPRMVLHLLHAQFAIATAFFPVALPTWLHVVLMVWAMLACQIVWSEFRRATEQRSSLTDTIEKEDEGADLVLAEE